MQDEILDRTVWRVKESDYPGAGTEAEQLKFLVRYAVLAPSSHNTQPWKFVVGDDQTIEILIDDDGWLRVADKDRRELYISLGCALENLLVAAEHFGFQHEVSYLPDASDFQLAARIKLTPRAESKGLHSSELFDSMTARFTSHKMFDARPVTQQDLERIRACSVEEGVEIFLTDDLEIKRSVEELVVRADKLEFADPEFREELGEWIGRGVFGTPWLAAKATQTLVTHLNVGRSTAKKDSAALMSAPVFGVVCSRANDRETQLKVGRVFERICLTATALGLSIQPLSQIVQVAEIKDELAKLLPISNVRPQQPFRLGYGEPESAHTPRKRFEEVLL